MSNNQNRNSLTLQQQVELLARASSMSRKGPVKAVISAIELNFSYESIMVLLNSFKHLSPSEDFDDLVEAFKYYELPEKLLEKLIKNNFSAYEIKKICEHLKSGDISIKNLISLSNYQLSKTTLYSQLSTIFFLLKNGFSFDSIIDNFSPDFSTKKMLYSLLKHKLNTLGYKISESDLASISIYGGIGQLETILSALDNGFSWQSIVNISKCSHISQSHVDKMSKLNLSEKEISLFTSTCSFERINLIFDAFERTDLSYDQISCLNKATGANEIFKEIIKFFSKD